MGKGVRDMSVFGKASLRKKSYNMTFIELPISISIQYPTNFTVVYCQVNDP